MIIVNFLKGKYHLARVFWIGFVGVSIAYNLISISVFNHIFTLLKLNESNFHIGYSLFFMLPFIYAPFIIVGVWNSARHYIGDKIWTISAQIIMILLGLGLLYYAGSRLFFQYSPTLTSEELIRLSDKLNETLPQIIEPNVLITKINFKDNHLLFQYQISNQLRSELHIKTLVHMFKRELKQQVCQDKFTQKVLNNHYILDYQYIDKNREEIYTFNFKKEDCSIN